MSLQQRKVNLSNQNDLFFFKVTYSEFYFSQLFFLQEAFETRHPTVDQKLPALVIHKASDQLKTSHPVSPPL